MSVEKIGTCSERGDHRSIRGMPQNILDGAGTWVVAVRWRKVQPSIRKCVFLTILMRPVTAFCFRFSASAVTFRFRKVKPLPLSAPSRALQTKNKHCF